MMAMQPPLIPITPQLCPTLQTCLKSIQAGQYSPCVHHSRMMGTPGGRKTMAFVISHLPVIIKRAGGGRQWGMLRQAWPFNAVLHEQWAMRNNVFFQCSSICFTVVKQDSHTIIVQNTVSTAMFGESRTAVM